MNDEIQKINDAIAEIDAEKAQLREPMADLQMMRDQLSLQSEQLGFSERYGDVQDAAELSEVMSRLLDDVDFDALRKVFGQDDDDAVSSDD